MPAEAIRVETERLVLRPVAREDFDAWAAFMADADSARFIDGAQPRAVAWRGFLWTGVIRCVDPTNVNSVRVAERLGSRWLRQTALPPPFGDKVCDVWGQSREQWQARMC